VNIQQVPIESIRVAEDRQLTDPGSVPALAQSIEELGLQQPIGVRTDGDGYSLVWGWKRLQATRQLGWTTIPACIVDMDDMHAELAEIDENLCRAELTAAQRAKQMARRKELYEALHPETRHGATLSQGPKRQNVVSGKASFTQDTAARTGKSKRTIERAVALGAKLDDKALAKIGAHPIADNQAELARLAEYDAPTQREIASRLARGQLQRVPERAREEALDAMAPSLAKALRDGLDCSTRDCVALAELEHREQQKALKEVLGGEFTSLHDWLHGAPVKSLAVAEPVPAPAVAQRRQGRPKAGQFQPVYDALGQAKKHLDGLMRVSNHANYRAIIARLDEASDLLTQWKGSLPCDS